MRIAIAVAMLFVSSALSAQQMPRSAEVQAGVDALVQKDYPTCARILSKQPEPSAAVGAARCYATMGNETEARQSLRKAMARGYRRCALLARTEELKAIAADFAAACTTNEDAFVRGVNPALFAAYIEDQNDRSGDIDDVEAVKKRDAARRELVRVMVAKHFVRSADDYYHAAMVMQHGDAAEARRLAGEAVRLRPQFPEARWLYAAATDRSLRDQGKPQIYGTQYRHDGTRWVLDPVDEHAVTDAERARWHVPSLQERREFIRKLNEQP
jgi:hypothetical protein